MRQVADAVRCLALEMAAQPEAMAYIHCTAGLGRAPATALAYMCADFSLFRVALRFMIEEWDLDEAYAHLPRGSASGLLATKGSNRDDATLSYRWFAQQRAWPGGAVDLASCL